MTTTRARPAKPSRRDAAADIAGRLFFERGYPEVTLRDVAAELGVTAPALYRHVRDKDDLLAAAILRGLDRIDDALAAAPGDGIDALVAVALERRDTWRLVERDARRLAAETRHAIGVRVAAVQGWVRERVSAHASGVSPDTLTRAVLGAVTAPSAYPAIASDADAASTIARVVRAMLAAPAGADEIRLRGVPRVPGRIVPRFEQLLNEAEELFGGRGYDEVSMSDIGDAVGIAGPSLYHYVDTKAELFAAVLQRGLDWLAFDRETATAVPVDDEEELRIWAESYAGLAVNRPRLFQVFLHERGRLDDPACAAVLRGYRELIDTWTALLRRARPELSTGPARMLVACGMSVLSQAAIGPDSPDRRAEAGRIAALALVAMRAGK